jgi:hypothetical protein
MSSASKIAKILVRSVNSNGEIEEVYFIIYYFFSKGILI